MEFPSFSRETEIPPDWSYRLSVLFLIIALEISVFGIPGLHDDGRILKVCWAFLFSSFALLHNAHLSGIAYDVRLPEGRERAAHDPRQRF